MPDRKLKITLLSVQNLLILCLIGIVNNNNKEQSQQVSVMLSQTSFISASSSTHGSYINSSKLLKIETHVFNRIVDLKNQKIELLSYLSKLIDRKYQAEDSLRGLLQIERQKQLNLAPEDQCKKAVHRYVELKSELEYLNRLACQRQSKLGFVDQLGSSKLGSQSRSKSVFELTKSRKLKQSGHSRSNNQLISNSKVGENQMKGSKISGVSVRDDEQEELIDQILSQRLQTDSLGNAQNQQNKIRQQQDSHSLDHQLNRIKKRIQNVRAVILLREQSAIVDKLSRTKQIVVPSQQDSEEGNLKQINLGTHESDAQVQIKQLLKYIEQEEEEKKLLYQQLNQFVQEMAELKAENQRMQSHEPSIRSQAD